MKKELPAKYYLAHFNELMTFITSECGHLLAQNHLVFINKISALGEQAQCMLARIYSRKPTIVAINTLNYDEIKHPTEALKELIQTKLIVHPNRDHYQVVLAHLTKPILLEILASFAPTLSIKKSATKAVLVTQACEFFATEPEHLNTLYEQYIINNRADVYEYFEFLYMGRLSTSDINHQNSFVLRDLGVTATRHGHNKSVARFETLNEAQSHYALNCFKRVFKNAKTHNDYHHLAHNVISQEAQDALAVNLKNKLLLRLYQQIKKEDIDLSLSLLNACENSPEAIEIQIREQYRQGNKQWVKAQLEQIIVNPLNDDILYFADDFLMRKFNKQTRSRLSTLLADTQCIINIDEIYRGNVEQGVNEHYTQRGFKVFNTENTLWQSLFGLVFWHPLYIDTPTPACNEFDLLPHVLKADCFYKTQHAQIDALLDAWQTAHDLLTHINKNAAHYYNQPNALFRWHSEILVPLEALILNSPLTVLKNHLKNMTVSFKQLKDGYPDLMILKGTKLHFEEVKAPGDKLRRNQLTTIDNLKKVGFDVTIGAVKWVNDPNRIYSVIDIETTGSLKGGHRITEIGLVKIQHAKVIDSWSTLINPQMRIPKFIVSLTGITDAMVANAPCFSDIAYQLIDKLKGTIFVAHNVNFDYGFIRKECERAGIYFKMPKLCTVVESRKAFPGLKSYSLGNLSTHFELSLTHHHRALADATATAELLLLIQQSSALAQ
ncbi:VRR-NUC domain-containing protein [Pseudoalteromonas sp. MMG010]|uniref:exonuclease domain-containing protein n=1 Tax=Pseudoalteromonas sp. MMG010 TaxID=2822685 RepID=UPI001B3A1122|nr:exonuclease domain-containing protein [Pseudoalteromonas sp. MMG010]MBQ4832022.1 VRR-NUC domain-containing protein [Pseudoalteromonas sp. MMG010]